MCTSKAIFTDVVSGKPDDTVGDTIQLLEAHGIRSIPVLDSEGVLTGFFHFRRVLARLLPITYDTVLAGSTQRSGMLDLDLKFSSILDSSAEHDVVDKMNLFFSVKLREVTDTDYEVAHPDTPLFEMIRLLIKYRGPLPIVNKGENKLIGLVTVQSMIQALKRIAAER